jgi:ribonuclease BN (tRNA processing enzyme)
MPTFEVTVLGVGDTFSERHHPTSLLLSCDGFQLAIDCPDMYRRVLRDAALQSGRPLSLPDIDHVLITHVHGDHMNGLEGVAFFKHFVEHKRVRLLASPEVLDVLWEQRLRAAMERLWDGRKFRGLSFTDYFDATPLAWTETTVVGPFTVRTRRTVHHVPTSALLVSAGGRTLGYSSDTAFDPELIAFLARADLIIHETNHGPAHTAYSELASLPAHLQARMRLVHYADQFDAAGSVIVPLREGQVLAV